MARFYRLLRGLWRLRPVTLGVLLVAAGGAWGYTWFGDGSGEDLLEGQTVVPIQYGDLVRQISTSGSLTFPNRESLTFGSVGTVEVLLVKDGQPVQEGEVLARLDGASVAGLAKATAQAQVDLNDAMDALDALLEPTPLALAEVWAAVAASELALEDAQTALDEANTPYSLEELKTQEQLVASARSAVQEAEDALANMGRQRSLNLSTAVLAKADAQVALEQARSDLAGFDLTHAGDLAQAAQDKTDAQAELIDAQTALKSYNSANSSFLSPARLETAEALASLEEAKGQLARLLAAQASGAGLEVHIQTLQTEVGFRQKRFDKAKEATNKVEQLEAAVELAQSKLDKAEATLASVGKTPDNVKRAQLQAAVELAQTDLADAEAALEESAETTTSTLLQDQLAKISGAEERLATAELEQSQLSAGSTGAAAAVTVAGAERDALVMGLAALEADADPVVVDLRQADLVQSWAQLVQREEDLADMLAGPDAKTVALRESELKVAAAALDEANQDLSDLLAGPDLALLALKKAEADSARLALDKALDNLSAAELKAPFDGLVSSVPVKEGDSISANTVIIEAVDPSVLEMDGIVDEIDVLSVREDLRAVVTINALPGRPLTGVVSEIAPGATNQQGVVTYAVRVLVEAPPGTQILEGLSAVASLILEQQENVLLVPQQAIVGTFDNPIVRVLTDAGVVEQPVALGDGDGFWFVAEEGLAAGDRVLIQSGQTISDQFGAFQQFRIGGGGTGPGGGGTRPGGIGGGGSGPGGPGGR